MRPVSALVVALVVVIGTVPIGAAASAGAAPAPAATSAATAQLQDGGVEAQTNESETPVNDTETEGDTDATDASDGTATSENASASNDTADFAPGAQLAGVIAVQRTEVSGEVESRTYGQRVAAAATNESKATIVASELNDSRERLEELRDRLEELESAHEAGELSEGQYRARTAQLNAEINALDRRLEQTNETASSLPAQVREERGINTSNVERLQSDAKNLSGSETAEAARGIGGGNAGRGLGDGNGPPGQVGGGNGPPGQVGDGNGPPGRVGDVPGGVDGAPGRNGSDARNDDVNPPGRSGGTPANASERNPGQRTALTDRNGSESPANGGVPDRIRGENATRNGVPGTDVRSASGGILGRNGSPNNDSVENGTAVNNETADGAPGRSGDAPGHSRGSGNNENLPNNS